MKFTIDPEIAALLDPLTEEEYRQLEANVVAAGRRIDPVRVWKEAGVLLDGHNGYQICTHYGLPYSVEYVSLPDRAAALDWVMKNQAGRRNWTPEQWAYYRGKMYQEQKRRPGRPANGTGNGEDTAAILARKYGVSEKTIHNDHDWYEWLEALSPEDCLRALRGELTRAEVRRMATCPPDPEEEDEEPEDEPERLDALGQPLSADAAQAFDALADLAAIEVHLRDALERARLTAAQPGGREIFPLLEKIAALRAEVKDARPYAGVCPWCHHAHPGYFAKKCLACAGEGWVTRGQWKKAPKKLRDGVLAKAVEI